MNISCPFCQIEISDTEKDSDLGHSCKDYGPHYFKDSSYPTQYFIFSTKNNELEFYQINVEVDDNLYGFDSYDSPLQVTELLRYTSDGDFKPFIKLDFFIPLPKSKEDIQNIVRRILNLKAFL